MRSWKPGHPAVGDKVKIDAIVTAVDGDNVTVQIAPGIVTTKQDLLKFDDPSETSPMVD